MKKRVLCLVLALLMCVSLFAACGSKTPASSSGSTPSSGSSGSSNPSASTDKPDDPVEENVEPVTLLMAHGFSQTGNVKSEGWQVLCDRVYELSNGSVTIEQVFDGAICGDAGMMDAVTTDVTQVGPIPFTYATGVIPELSALCIPGWFVGDVDTYEKFDEEIFDVMSRIFEKYGYKYIGGDYPGQASFFGNGQPILDLASIKGRLMRVSGTDQINAVETWGGAATIIPLPDLTTALDRGTVDSAMSGYQLIHVFSLYEVIDWAVILPFAEPGHGYFMTLDCWNSLAPSQQDAIMEGFSGSARFIWEASDEQEYVPYLQEYRDAGVEVYEPTAAEMQEMIDALKPNFEALKEGACSTPEGLELLKIVYKYNGWEWTD
ncbi:MAG: TRAP transporter substrate-binding protein [Oscillospiraceae bacterium]